MGERMRAWAKDQGCVGDRVRVCDAATCVIDSGAGFHGFAIRGASGVACGLQGFGSG